MDQPQNASILLNKNKAGKQKFDIKKFIFCKKITVCSWLQFLFFKVESQ